MPFHPFTGQILLIKCASWLIMQSRKKKKKPQPAPITVTDIKTCNSAYILLQMKTATITNMLFLNDISITFVNWVLFVFFKS